MLRYTSLPNYKLMAKVFNLPCVSTLQKMVSGKLCVKKTLKESGNISTLVIVILMRSIFRNLKNILAERRLAYMKEKKYSKECFLLCL